MPLPEAEFYVSVAPFVTHTHECYHHSLSGCQGELPEEDVAVTITDSSGEVLVNEEVTDDNGDSGAVFLSTPEGSPTGITTLQLEPATPR